MHVVFLAWLIHFSSSHLIELCTFIHVHTAQNWQRKPVTIHQPKHADRLDRSPISQTASSKQTPISTFCLFTPPRETPNNVLRVFRQVWKDVYCRHLSIPRPCFSPSSSSSVLNEAETGVLSPSQSACEANLRDDAVDWDVTNPSVLVWICMLIWSNGPSGDWTMEQFNRGISDKKSPAYVWQVLVWCTVGLVLMYRPFRGRGVFCMIQMYWKWRILREINLKPV